MRLSVDRLSISKRLAELQKEIEEIAREDRLSKKKGHRGAPRDLAAHDKRVLRMRRVLEEIARLTPRKIGPDV